MIRSYAGRDGFSIGLCEVQDRVTSVQTKRVFERVESLARCFIAAIHDPPVGLQKDCWTEKTVAVQPIARASRRAIRT